LSRQTGRQAGRKADRQKDGNKEEEKEKLWVGVRMGRAKGEEGRRRGMKFWFLAKGAP
jgi:hypothetical protein